MQDQHGEVDFRRFLRMIRIIVDKDAKSNASVTLQGDKKGVSSASLRAAAAARQKAIAEKSMIDRQGRDSMLVEI